MKSQTSKPTTRERERSARSGSSKRCKPFARLSEIHRFCHFLSSASERSVAGSNSSWASDIGCPSIAARLTFCAHSRGNCDTTCGYSQLCKESAGRRYAEGLIDRPTDLPAINQSCRFWTAELEIILVRTLQSS